ncbi:hypothetical protein Taro_051840 [Colocasia esculenta]|nr:hypothetical protein [Colocasia esculenta]
MDGRHM